jgi:septal ring factor EnvC (AmiA/AmiB activator)
MFKNDIEFFIQCAILLIVFLAAIIGFISGYRLAKSRKRREEELSRLMYSLLKKTRELDDDYLSLKEQNQQYANDIKRLQEMINSLGVLEQKNAGSISSLTSSIQNVIQENKRRENTKIYPTPQLSEMIKTTIGEYVHQEIVFIRDMRIPISPTDPVTVKITRNTIKTYPHVDEEWIAKKVVEIVTEASRE